MLAIGSEGFCTAFAVRPSVLATNARCIHEAKSRTGSVKARDEIIGNNVRVKVVKNKVAPPFREVEFDIMYGEGISKLGEIIDLGVKAGVVEKSGAWYSYGDERIGQGRENAKQFLRDHPDMALQIEDKIRASHGLDFGAAEDDGGDQVMEG
jgi:recombination protein RecA